MNNGKSNKTIASREKNDHTISGTNPTTFSSEGGAWVVEEIKIEAEKTHDVGFCCKIQYPGVCRD